ncbi:MAG TPA: hypothetical protein ENJ60_10560 [Aeromonadales bacterium]|nr:hypothetical protein [Aeromonadales bacterium]
MNKDRTKLKLQYKNLYSDIESILFKHDLMGINYEYNTDEYEPEVDTIIPRLKEAKNIEDVTIIVYEEFLRWFGIELMGKKNNEKYKSVATEIWKAWVKYTYPLA